MYIADSKANAMHESECANHCNVNQMCKECLKTKCKVNYDKIGTYATKIKQFKNGGSDDAGRTASVGCSMFTLDNRKQTIPNSNQTATRTQYYQEDESTSRVSHPPRPRCSDEDNAVHVQSMNNVELDGTEDGCLHNSI